MVASTDLRAMLLADFGIDFPISGGPGNSREAPIVIHYATPNDYVGVEHSVVSCLCTGRGVEWRLLLSSLIEHSGRRIEQMKIETKWATESQLITQIENYYFDITDCFGRIE
jgi:hypothetical protein